MRIDCSITENFFKEWERYCAIQPACNHCGQDDSCPVRVSKANQFNRLSKFVEEIQAWSDENPQKTYLEDLLEKYPEIELNDEGVPIFCPSLLGYQQEVCPSGYCNVRTDCWNKVLKEKK